ncbi:natural killer cells antigen CD94-like [Tachyglossus aculeatus]|uniref:natural killer cells antigen CD94-like n=1 Tax=Tachyglossus aculeatus TaxID=9261 RepID=UPI0018F28B35|nr:natural killer cells antigen CD94-like [Tachyglossus aculeatus]
MNKFNITLTSEMSEQNAYYAEMKPPNPSRKQKRGNINGKREDSVFTPWSLLAATLGVLSLILMASVLALGILMTNQSPNHGTRNSSSPYNSTSQKGCNCGSCPENWIWNKWSCYYISKDEKTWPDSKTACANMNSSLLKIDSKKELENFLTLLKTYYWIGLSHNSEAGQWQWQDGSTLSSELLSVTDHFPKGTCAFYGLKNIFSYESCTYSTTYICEKRAM